MIEILFGGIFYFRRGMDMNYIEEYYSNYDEVGAGTGRYSIALDLSMFSDESFDITLFFGPMYHLYTKEDKLQALQEAIIVWIYLEKIRRRCLYE